MNRTVIFMVLLFAWIATQAQTERRIYTKVELERAQNVDNTQGEKLSKKQEKLLKELRDSLSFVMAVDAMEKLDFVLEADQLMFKRGETAYVTANTNFISLLGDAAVVQVAPFHSGGSNGVGGITVEGRASNIKIKTDKKGNVSFTMNVMGSGVSASVEISIPKGSNRATATIYPNFHSNRVTLVGTLLPTEFSNVFKGQSLP